MAYTARCCGKKSERCQYGVSDLMIKFRIQGTPNPKARKYLIDRDLKSAGKVTYKNKKECAHLPMGVALFAVPGVEQHLPPEFSRGRDNPARR